MLLHKKEATRIRRRLRIRKKVLGTAVRPRLCVYKSFKHLHVQAVDDAAGRTLGAATTNTKANKESGKKSFANIAAAKALGAQVGRKLIDAGITQVVFDRSGYPY